MKTTSLMLLSAAFALSAMASCTQNDHVPAHTYVLVHGAWQAPYVWNEVSAQLTSSGNKVIVVELPGHGSDQTAPHLLSLDVYRDKVVQAVLVLFLMIQDKLFDIHSQSPLPFGG